MIECAPKRNNEGEGRHYLLCFVYEAQLVLTDRSQSWQIQIDFLTLNPGADGTDGSFGTKNFNVCWSHGRNDISVSLSTVIQHDETMFISPVAGAKLWGVGILGQRSKAKEEYERQKDLL